MDEAILERKLSLVLPHLNERQRRLLLAAEARSLGRGGISLVARVAKVSRPTIHLGLRDLDGSPPSPEGRARRPGGGRKRLKQKDPALVTALEALVDPDTRGDPISPLRWTCKSTRELAETLTGQGHRVNHRLVGELLHEADYSLQGNAKRLEGVQHPDRDAQFRYISEMVKAVLTEGLPAVSVDAKKKELVGAFKNGGREWQSFSGRREPEVVHVHDFPDPKLGKAIPYSIYDVGRNAGWVTRGQGPRHGQFRRSLPAQVVGGSRDGGLSPC